MDDVKYKKMMADLAELIKYYPNKYDEILEIRSAIKDWYEEGGKGEIPSKKKLANLFEIKKLQERLSDLLAVENNLTTNVNGNTNDRKHNILLVFTNSQTSPAFNQKKEQKFIQEAIGYQNQNIDIKICYAVTVHELHQELLNNKYNIVHISGHGYTDGLEFEDETGNGHVVSPESLAKLFKSHTPPLECVVLNACYSVSQGQHLSMDVDYTIVSDGLISDTSARVFARGFYTALSKAYDFNKAYEAGCISVALESTKTVIPEIILLTKEKDQVNLRDNVSLVKNMQIMLDRITARQELALKKLNLPDLNQVIAEVEALLYNAPNSLELKGLLEQVYNSRDHMREKLGVVSTLLASGDYKYAYQYFQSMLKEGVPVLIDARGMEISTVAAEQAARSAYISSVRQLAVERLERSRIQRQAAPKFAIQILNKAVSLLTDEPLDERDKRVLRPLLEEIQEELEYLHSI